VRIRDLAQALLQRCMIGEVRVKVLTVMPG